MAQLFSLGIKATLDFLLVDLQSVFDSSEEAAVASWPIESFWFESVADTLDGLKVKLAPGFERRAEI